MITQIKAYTELEDAPTLPIDVDGSAETDLIQIRDIQGLDPVDASIGTSQYGSVDGASPTGNTVNTRNIVMTIGLNPDWGTNTYSSLRRLIYGYFIPKRRVKLEFYCDDMADVQILGYVEKVTINPFSKDPEFQISIICPDPHFTAIEESIFTGHTDDAPLTIDYQGSVPAGILVKVSDSGAAAPGTIGVNIGVPPYIQFLAGATVASDMYFELSSVPLRKWIRNVMDSEEIISLLGSEYVDESGSFTWPVLQPGENKIAIVTDVGSHDWTLRYFERFGGL